MIKKLFSAALLIFTAGIINSYAQCTPNISCIPQGTDYGICPDSATGIATGIVGVPYSQALSIKTPPTAAHWGTPSATIDSLVVTGVDSLAPGLTYVCVPSRSFVPGSGCILISGTPTQAWHHTIVVHITPHVYAFFTHLTATPTTNTQYRSIVYLPAPILTSTLTPSPICSGTAFNYVPLSNTTGTTFAWTRAVVTGISNAAASGTGNPAETLVNTTANPVNVTYSYVLSAANTGSSSPYSVVVTVNPSPSLGSSLTPAAICSGTAFSYTPTSLTTGATFTWTRAAVTGISNIAGSGTGNPNETLTNTTATPINVTYNYTVTAGGCVNPNVFSVVVTVNLCSCSQAMNSSLAPPAICSGTAFNYTPTSTMANTTFAWARAAITGISNAAASGTGNPNETLTNTTAAVINVTYVYSLTLSGCTNTYSVVVPVNPIPTLNSTLTPASICSGSVFSYTPTSATTGATFAWTRAMTAGISNLAASGTANPNEILINTSAAPVNVTYVFTANANGCVNPATYSVVVTVNSAPAMNSTLTPAAICSGVAFSYMPTSGASGATFSWTRAAVTGISNAAASGSAGINETLVNTTTSPVNVTYVYTVSANGCTNPVTYNVVVTVNTCITCTQSLSSTLTPPPICSGHTFSYVPTSSTTGTTFAWTRAAVTGISNIAATGTGNPNEILNNTTANSINVTYVYSLTANGCTNTTTYSVVVTVQTCTGIQENLFSQNVTVYPNPTNGSFKIAIKNAAFGELLINIFDVQGREVYSASDKNNSNDYIKEINLKNLAKGTYTIKLSAGADVKIQKIVIE